MNRSLSLLIVLAFVPLIIPEEVRSAPCDKWILDLGPDYLIRAVVESEGAVLVGGRKYLPPNQEPVIVVVSPAGEIVYEFEFAGVPGEVNCFSGRGQLASGWRKSPVQSPYATDVAPDREGMIWDLRNGACVAAVSPDPVPPNGGNVIFYTVWDENGGGAAGVAPGGPFVYEIVGNRRKLLETPPGFTGVVHTSDNLGGVFVGNISQGDIVKAAAWMPGLQVWDDPPKAQGSAILCRSESGTRFGGYWALAPGLWLNGFPKALERPGFVFSFFGEIKFVTDFGVHLGNSPSIGPVIYIDDGQQSLPFNEFWEALTGRQAFDNDPITGGALMGGNSMVVTFTHHVAKFPIPAAISAVVAQQSGINGWEAEK